MIDPSWLDRTSAWWAKADRAQDHLRSLRKQVDEFRASNPYTLTPEPTSTPDRVAYRLRIHRPIPVVISTIVGDVLHNLRSALDSLAYKIAVRGLGRPLNDKELKACAFPVRETPGKFDEFFDKEWPVRASMYHATARAAFRAAQPFSILEGAHQAGVAGNQTYEDEYKWDELSRLTVLSNLDKHRRPPVMAWSGPDFLYWMSNGPSNRRWFPQNVPLTDGAILAYMVGRDPGMDEEVFHEFNLVLDDDPARDPNDPGRSTQDVVDMLEGWHRHVIFMFYKVFSAL